MITYGDTSFHNFIALDEYCFLETTGFCSMHLRFPQEVGIRQLPPITVIQNYHSYQLRILPDRFKILDFIPDKFPVKYSDRLQTITSKLQL
jgi:hypothetical protein